MVAINHYILKPAEIINILTLRYNISLKTQLPKLSWKDFTPNNETPSIDFIEKTIENSIESKLHRSIKKIVMALSGGIDSTLVLALIKKTSPEIDIEAISIKFAQSTDESKKAAMLAENFDINHNIIYLENYFLELPKAISIIKQPFWDHHWYYVAKSASKLSNHIVSGDGGDELFGGYTFRYKKFLELINSNSTPKEKLKAYLECHERDRVPDQEAIFGKKSKFSWKSIYSILLPYFDNTLNPIEQVFLADYNGKLLYNFEPANRSINNHFGLESITPILSSELISYATHISPSHKYDFKKNIGKIPLRMILHKNKVDCVASEKLGFSINTVNLWKSYGYRLCEEYLLGSRIIEDGWIKKDWIKKHFKKDNLDIRYVNKFLGLLAFEIWYRIFIVKDMNENILLK